ncbi:hypothetical protein scyTo_0011008 [Scyliorhinus torazame]|uniref:Uncharacterized protein n=1 Tax=Scyliorhinus torazame TaxID=75743 RepID=A0A401NG12_SCYTO|nr:hypothetical protein [Scyliorhinus torazame]
MLVDAGMELSVVVAPDELVDTKVDEEADIAGLLLAVEVSIVAVTIINDIKEACVVAIVVDSVIGAGVELPVVSATGLVDMGVDVELTAAVVLCGPAVEVSDVAVKVENDITEKKLQLGGKDTEIQMKIQIVGAGVDISVVVDSVALVDVGVDAEFDAVLVISADAVDDSAMLVDVDVGMELSVVVAPDELVDTGVDEEADIAVLLLAVEVSVVEVTIINDIYEMLVDAGMELSVVVAPDELVDMGVGEEADTVALLLAVEVSVVAEAIINDICEDEKNVQFYIPLVAMPCVVIVVASVVGAGVEMPGAIDPVALVDVGVDAVFDAALVVCADAVDDSAVSMKIHPDIIESNQQPAIPYSKICLHTNGSGLFRNSPKVRHRHFAADSKQNVKKFVIASPLYQYDIKP